jgi:hypothetical protein
MDDYVVQQIVEIRLDSALERRLPAKYGRWKTSLDFGLTHTTAVRPFTTAGDGGCACPTGNVYANRN